MAKKKIRPRNALILPRPWNRRRGHGTNGFALCACVVCRSGRKDSNEDEERFACVWLNDSINELSRLKYIHFIYTLYI